MQGRPEEKQRPHERAKRRADRAESRVGSAIMATSNKVQQVLTSENFSVTKL